MAIYTILFIVEALIVLIGFFIGLKRGAVKATVRFAELIIVAIASFFIGKWITDFLSDKATELLNSGLQEPLKSVILSAPNAEELLIDLVGALLLPNELTGATVIPNGSVKGHVAFAPTDDQFDTVSVIESRIKVTVAGSAAEELVIGERSIGALTDLRNARKMLVTLVFGLGAYNIRYAGIYTTLPVAKAASEYILSRGDEIYLAKMEELYNKSRTILQENKEAVLAVARALMAKSSLSAEEIFEICGTVGGSAA